MSKNQDPFEAPPDGTVRSDPRGWVGGRPRGPRPPARLGLAAAGGVVVVAALALGIVALGSFEKTQGGEIAVIRNGGPLDNNKVRQVIQPASARTYSGLFSKAHHYPAQQRLYTITADESDGDRAGVNVEQVPTADGVEVASKAPSTSP